MYHHYISHFQKLKVETIILSVALQWKSMFNIVQLAVCLNPFKTCRLGLYNNSTILYITASTPNVLKGHVVGISVCRLSNWFLIKQTKNIKKCPKFTTENLQRYTTSSCKWRGLNFPSTKKMYGRSLVEIPVGRHLGMAQNLWLVAWLLTRLYDFQRWSNNIIYQPHFVQHISLRKHPCKVSPLAQFCLLVLFHPSNYRYIMIHHDLSCW